MAPMAVIRGVTLATLMALVLGALPRMTVPGLVLISHLAFPYVV